MRKRLVKLERDPERLAEKILATLDRIEYERKKQNERAKRLVKTFEDPVEVIADEIEKTVIS